jgi:hypothetical protein
MPDMPPDLKVFLRYGAVCLVMAVVPAYAQGPATVVPVMYPGASQTTPRSVNNLNQVVGDFNPGNGTVVGFIRAANGTYAQFTCPNGDDVHPYNINNLGVIVGTCGVPAIAHGFIRDAAGRFTMIDFPGAAYTEVTAVNDVGQTAGYYAVQAGGQYVLHGFIRDVAGNWTIFDVPNTTQPVPVAMNSRGQVVGRYWGGTTWLTFLRDTGGSVITFASPGIPTSIDTAGRVFGQTQSAGTQWMRDESGTIIPLAVPASAPTQLTGVNDAGVMTGILPVTASGFVSIPCAAASITPAPRLHGPGNETGTVQVTAPISCAWTSVSYVDWLAHPSGASAGTGNQRYIVQPNNTGQIRTGIINVAGQNITITQQAGTCTYSLTGTGGVSPFGGSGVINIVTPPACGWVASAAEVQPYGVWQPVTWLTISAPAEGFGSGTVRYTAMSCPGCSSAILIGGQAFTVTAAEANWQLFKQDDGNGALTAWYMTGASRVAAASLPSAGVGWRLAATADFDGNGVRDLIWQHEASGVATLWYMGGANGADLLSWAWLDEEGSDDWRIVAAFDFSSPLDFDNNHVPDIVWQHKQTREVTVWYMSSVNRTPSLLGWDWLSGPQQGWRMVGAAQTGPYGEGTTRLNVFWQHDVTGAVTAWVMSPAYMGSSLRLVGWTLLANGFGSDWRVVGLPAMGGAGQPGMIWQSESTRKLTVWYMPLLTFAGWEYLDPNATPGAHAIAR